MNHFAQRVGAFATVVILYVGGLSASFAQEFRENPFLPSTTSQEQLLIAERERVRQSIREMMPEIKSLLAASFEDQKTQILSEVAANAAAAATTDNDGNPISNNTQATAQTPSIPEGSKWVGCINGKAVYRDQNGIKFFVETPDMATQCP